MNNQLSAAFFSAALALVLVTPAHALPVQGQGTWVTTLLARDLDRNGVTDAFYDTDLNVTWLREASFDQRLNLPNVIASVASLSFGGFSDWRMPTVLDSGTVGCNFSVTGGTDCGFNVDTTVKTGVNSELAHLFYITLGNVARYDTNGNDRTGIAGKDYGLINTGNFQNMQASTYWSSSSYAPLAEYAWIFETSDGRSSYASKDYMLFTMVVRSGDVVSAVPEPATYPMLLAGLGLVGFSASRKTQVESTFSHDQLEAALPA